MPPVVAVENDTPGLATETINKPNKDLTQVLVSPSGGQSRALSAGDTTAVPGAADMLPLRRATRDINPPRLRKFSFNIRAVNPFLGGEVLHTWLSSRSTVELRTLDHCTGACAMK